MNISIQSTEDGYATVEIKKNRRYAAVRGKLRGAFPVLLIIKAFIKLKFGGAV